MTPAQYLILMQWLSPAFPVGAFSYSHGLETAVATGQIANAQDLNEWLEDLLALGSGRNDAILLSAAYRAETEADLADIVELAQALSASQERLLETTRQGAAFVSTFGAVWGETLQEMPYPLALGVAAKIHDIPLETTAYAYLHAFSSNLVSAAIRLVPLGQTEGQTCLQALNKSCETIGQEAAASTLDDLGACAFASDIASMQHETLRPRLFQS